MGLFFALTIAGPYLELWLTGRLTWHESRIRLHYHFVLLPCFAAFMLYSIPVFAIDFLTRGGLSAYTIPTRLGSSAIFWCLVIARGWLVHAALGSLGPPHVAPLYFFTVSSPSRPSWLAVSSSTCSCPRRSPPSSSPEAQLTKLFVCFTLHAHA